MNKFSLANVSLAFVGSPDADLANIAAAGSGDGWALIAKYGDHPHPGPPGANTPILQRFGKPDAENLVANFNAGSNRIRRATVGVPIYDGHPDAAGLERIFPDKTAHGTFAELAARDDGLYGRPILTNSGSRLVEDFGKDRLSPLWQCETTGEKVDGRVVVKPTRLKSVGLVTKGNIPGPSLLNASFSAMNKTKLIQLLALLGLTVAADSDDAALGNAVDQGLTAATSVQKTKTDLEAANSELTTVKAKLTTLEAEKNTLANAATERDTLKTDLANAKKAVEAERKERAVLLVNAAFTEGRLPATERDATILALCNAADFATEAGRLAARTKLVKTTSATDDLSKNRGTGATKAQQVLDLVNARMDAKKESYEVAYQNVMLTTEYKALMEPAAKG